MSGASESKSPRVGATPVSWGIWAERSVVRALELDPESSSKFCGPCLARGVALRGLTATQILKLFPARSRRKNAYKLRTWAGRISGRRARRVLAAASWHQIRAAAQHQEEEAQIRAAIAYSVAKGSPHEQHPVPPRMSLVTIRESSINAVSR